MTTVKTSLCILGALPVLAFLVGPAEKLLRLCAMWLSNARRVDPRVEEAIARHPSMHANAYFKIPACGQTIFAPDPMDLVARQISHQLNCLQCIASKETAA